MNETEFNQRCDDIMLAIEEAIDDSGADIDYETSAGVLTLTVEQNHSKIIISRQPALNQIWVAARSGGYYFEYGKAGTNDWICTATGETLADFLQRVCEEQEGGKIEFVY
jgi:CyaY protein